MGEVSGDSYIMVEHMLQFQARGAQREIDVGHLFATNQAAAHDAPSTPKNTRSKNDADMERKSVVKRLGNQPYLTAPSNPLFYHGRIFKDHDSQLSKPTRTWKSDLKPRDDHGDTPDWLTA